MANDTLTRPRIFVDTSVVVAGVFSGTGGSRLLLELGESRVVDLVVGSSVLAELDGVIGRKAPSARTTVARLLDSANVAIGRPPTDREVKLAARLIAYRPDAVVLAEALASQPDYLVSLDKRHFLTEPTTSSLPFPVGSPGECLTWLRGRFKLAVRARPRRDG